MLKNSAFITVGEPAKRLAEVQEKQTPRGEFAILNSDYFSRVVSMMDKGSKPGSLFSGIEFALWAYRQTKDYENIYISEEFPGIQYLAWQATFRRRKRIVMLVHNVASKKRRLMLHTLGLARHVDHFLCLSPYSKRVLIEQYGAPESKITVIYSRVDTDFFAPDSQAQVKHQICSAGAVNRDYQTLIEAAGGLSVEVKIAADTAWQYSASSPKQAADLPGNVEMHSWGNYLNLRQLYAESKMVIVPLLSRQCLSGITVALEGMAMGKAVILTHNPYVEGFIEDGKTGFYVTSGDPEQLRAKIAYLLEHPEIANEVGQRARIQVEAEFTVEKYIQRIMSVWDRLN